MDNSVGEQAYPPAPPRGVLDARFNLPIGTDDSIKDYRHMSQGARDLRAVYKVQFQPGSGDTIVLKWNLPNGVTGQLQDVITGNMINRTMQGAGSYEVENPETFDRLNMVIIYNFTTTPTVPTLDIDTNTTVAPPVVITPVSSSTPPVVPNNFVKTKNATFDFPLTITDGGNRNQILNFGLDDTASDGIDTALGELSYPPMPPVGVFDARFVLPGGSNDSLADYRKLTTGGVGKISNLIHYQVGEGQDDIKISWNLPENITGNLYDVFGGQKINALMKCSGSYTVSEPQTYNKLIMMIDYYQATVAQSVSPVVPNPQSVPTPEVPVNIVNPEPQPITTEPTAEPAPVNNQDELHNINPISAPVVSEELALEEKKKKPQVTEDPKKIEGIMKDLSANLIKPEAKTSIEDFISKGVDLNTEKLGMGERAAVIFSYQNAFGKLPESETEMNDAIKIASGRYPSLLSETAENKARLEFKKIYKKEVDNSNERDRSAVVIMAYGLRQKAENRNLESEKAGIRIFKDIYGYVPESTHDWNIMQAITYSGAKR